MNPQCPKCRAPLTEGDVEVVGMIESEGDNPAAFDVNLQCPACDARFFVFINMTEWCEI